MKIKLWGVRGSIATTGPDTEIYGGNTSCVTVTHDDYVLVLDGGTGIRQLSGSNYPLHKRIDVLLTHLHLDHIQGLGFFSPLFDATKEIHIWGACQHLANIIFKAESLSFTTIVSCSSS